MHGWVMLISGRKRSQVGLVETLRASQESPTVLLGLLLFGPQSWDGASPFLLLLRPCLGLAREPERQACTRFLPSGGPTSGCRLHAGPGFCLLRPGCNPHFQVTLNANRGHLAEILTGHLFL